MKSIFFLLLISLSWNALADLRVVASNSPPTNYKEGDKVVGITVDIVNSIMKKVNTPTTIEIMSWARAYNIASNEPNVAIFTAGRTQARIDHGFHFIGPVTTRKHAVYAKKNRQYKINSIDDIIAKGYSVGLARGDWRTKLFEKGNLVESTSSPQNAKKLASDRIDLWVASDLAAPMIAKNAGVNMDEFEIVYVIKEAASYIMLSKDTSAETVSRWKNAMSTLQQTDFFKETASQWKEKGLDLDYQPEKGFFPIN